MLEQGHDSIDDVARESGFTSRDHMRRAFLRAYGQPPQALRRSAGKFPLQTTRTYAHQVTTKQRADRS